MANVPPVKIASRFSNPHGPSDSDDDMFNRQREEQKERPLPLDIIDSTMEKQLDALVMLLATKYFPGRTHRYCSNLSLPTEFLQYSDLRWVIAPAVSMNECSATDAEIEKDLQNHGKRSLANIFEHREDDPVIDSPRSILVMIRSGFSSESLRAGADETTESRRTKMIASLRQQYEDLEGKLSCKGCVRYLRKAHMDKAVRQTSCLENSPVRERAKTPEKAVPKPKTKATPVPSQVGKNAQISRREVRRVMLHRENITSDWGAHQQQVVTESYVWNRVSECMKERESTRRQRARLCSIPRSPDRQKVVSDSGSSLNQTQTNTNTKDDTSSRSSPQSSPPKSRPQSRQSPTITQQQQPPHTRNPREVVAHFRKLEAERLDKLQQQLDEKAERAAECMRRRQEELRARSAKGKARQKEVKEVNERMYKNTEFRNLLLIQQMEAEALSEHERQEKLKREAALHGKMLKERRTLQAKTQKAIQEGVRDVDKVIFKQEMASTSPVHLQRKLKEESKEKLRKLLKNEDRLIREWKRLEGVE